MKRKRNYQSGMTLIELMFAVGVVAMSLSIIFGALISISIMGRLNMGRTEAAASLSSVLEELNTLPFSSVTTYVPPELKGPGKAFELKVEAVIPGSGGSGDEESGETAGTETSGEERIAIPLPEEFDMASLPNPVEIVVTLTWQDDRGYVFRSVASTMKER